MENRGWATDLGMRVWIREQHDSLRVLAEQPKALRVYYEDLCDDTTATLARIHRFVGVEPQSLGGDFRADENHILGNSMRLGGGNLMWPYCGSNRIASLRLAIAFCRSLATERPRFKFEVQHLTVNHTLLR